MYIFEEKGKSYITMPLEEYNEEKSSCNTSKFLLKVMIIFYIIICLLFGLYKISSATEYVKLPKPLFNKMVKQIEFLQEVQKANPEINIENLDIVIDSNNRVYLKDTVSVSIKVSELRYKGEIRAVGSIKVYNTYKTNLVSKFGLLYAYTTKSNYSMYANEYKKGLYLYYDVLQLNKFSINLISNFNRYGAGIGYKITNNTKCILGISNKYNESNSKPFIGLGFNF